MDSPSVSAKKLPIGRKIAFACGDIFGGGSFNIINFLFVPFLTLVVGVPMIWASPILLLAKVWDGLIDPFIGELTDSRQPGKFGKRRIFMLIFAPVMFICLILLFFPWNLVTDSVALKIVLVTLFYMLYATAQSLILIPYYSLASEITDDYNERNKANALRIAFSVAASIICVAVPGMIASPTKGDGGKGYILMAAIFGFIFCGAVIITAFFAKEQVVTPAIRNRVSLKQFFRPLKLKTYRRYLGMQMCTSMAMAVMSSFFFIYCDFYIRRHTYFELTSLGAGYSRFPIATVAAAMMFIAQIFALPMYLKIIKAKSKRFAYITSAIIWCVLCVVMAFLPAETTAPEVVGNVVKSVSGTPDILLLILAFAIGFGIGGCVYVPHSSLGDVCNTGELYFGERTEGAFSGLTNFLNTTAQAIGLAIPPVLLGLGGYIETQYISTDLFNQIKNGSQSAEKHLGMALEYFKITQSSANVQLVPMQQSKEAQIYIMLTMVVLPVLIMGLGIFIASRYKMTKQTQERIIAALAMDRQSDEFAKEREDILNSL